MDNKKIYEIVKQSSLVESKKLDESLKLAETQNKSLENILLENNLISIDYLNNAISEFYKVPYIKLSDQAIDKQILKKLPELSARKHQCVIFSEDENGLKIATSNPEDQKTFDFLANKLGQKITVYYSSPKEITEALNLYKKELGQTFKELIKTSAENKVIEAPIEEIVQKLFEYALDNHASDIHIEPYEQSTVIRFRIDGVLHDVAKLPKSLHEQIVSRVKVLSNLRIDEQQAAQDGKLVIKYQNDGGVESDSDARVSIAPITEGENVVIRLLSERTRQFNLTNLGFSESNLQLVKREIAKSWGTILVVGPTGSGKTTTLYAIMKLLNKREVNIATIEDPVEYDIEGVGQIQVNKRTDLTFANGLRSIVRQDPDIIMVGEIRDEETAGIAINAAMTGHLVLSTLHANDAATTLPRLLKMKIEPYLIASTINLVVAQRIIRRVCKRCMVSKQIPIETFKANLPERVFNKFFAGKSGSITVSEGKGCAACQGSGYSGRIGIFEILEISPNIEKLIMSQADASQINDQAVKDGMVTMLEDGIDKVLKGITTFEEVLKITRE